MTYKELIELGFKRFEFSDDFDLFGFNDFYLHLKVNKDITFEWHWKERDIVRMVRYKKQNVKNYAIIEDIETLKSFIDFYMKYEGNKGVKTVFTKKTTQ